MKRKKLPKERLGDLLLRAGSVDTAGLQRALERQQMQPGRLGSQLLALGLVQEDDLAEALTLQYRVPPFLPSLAAVERAALERVPAEMARRLGVLPVAWDGSRGVLTLAVTDPGDVARIDEVRFASGARRTHVLVAPEQVVERLYLQYYEGVEPAAQVPPELTFDLGWRSSAVSPAEQRASSPHGNALVGDGDGRRGRAVAGVLEAAGMRVRRVRSREEWERGRDQVPAGTALWLHRELAEPPPEGPVWVYDDPLQGLQQGLVLGERLLPEALALAADAGRRLGLEEQAGRALPLVRLLAVRMGLREAEVHCLELRAWRLALNGWQDPAPDTSLAGIEILGAVAAYQRALARGATPTQAAQRVRADPELDADAVTRLLRWVEGVDLLSRLEGRRRALLVFPDRDQATPLAAHLERSGWEVTVAGEFAVGDDHDVILAAFGAGLAHLERVAEAGGEAASVFLVAHRASEPEIMYALRLGAEDVFEANSHPEVVETKLARAAARRGGVASTEITGDLRDMGLADMLQILSNGLKTACIRIDGPAGTGAVNLEQGQIVHARCGDLVGETALYEMIAWEAGPFRISPEEAAPAHTVQGSTEGLIMEGFRLLDESRRDAAT